MRSQRSTRGLTLLEILVALVILSVVLTGFGNVLTVARKYLSHSRARLCASELTKYYLSPLAAAVREDNYTTGLLAENAARHSPEEPTVDGILYNGTYNISSIILQDGTRIRCVNLTIHWNEKTNATQ
jgi:prepilin-type N-terminal cleavage/methylation domain-containing protein